ncbi:MAG: tetratricopeptide repeat protein [Lachnospira sp.]
MKKKLITTMLVLVMTVCMVAGCGSVENVVDRTEETAKSAEAAECYEKGRAALFGMNDNKFNLEEAYNNFVKAKELGYADANFYLGVLCDWYNYPKNDYEAAKVYYEAYGENPYAQMAIAFLYMSGMGVEKDYAKAMEWYEKAANLGHYVAMQNIGDMFFKGKGVEKNYAKAFEWYEKSAELGDEDARERADEIREILQK